MSTLNRSGADRAAPRGHVTKEPARSILQAPVDRDQTNKADKPQQVPLPGRRVCSKHDSEQAWARRRADLGELVGIDEVLDDINARADGYYRRIAALLNTQTVPSPND